MKEAAVSYLQECFPENLIQSLKIFKYMNEKQGGQVPMTSYHHNAQNDETKFQLRVTTRKMKLEICKPVQALQFCLIFTKSILKISGPALYTFIVHFLPL